MLGVRCSGQREVVEVRAGSSWNHQVRDEESSDLPLLELLIVQRC